MVSSNQLTPGMILSMDGKLFRVESSVKVTVAKGQPFIKTKLCNLANEKTSEKNFKIGQELSAVTLEERRLEYLYLEGKDYLFLDVDKLEQIEVPSDVIAEKVNFLKEGIQLEAKFYGETISSLELPQFLELMVAKTAPAMEGATMTNTTKEAVLETGASMQVPPFVETGDVIKVDTRTKEYIQRV